MGVSISTFCILLSSRISICTILLFNLSHMAPSKKKGAHARSASSKTSRTSRKSTKSKGSLRSRKNKLKEPLNTTESALTLKAPVQEPLKDSRELYLMIRRLKTTIFLNVSVYTTLYKLKRMIEGILKVRPEDQRLFKKGDAITDGPNKGKSRYLQLKVSDETKEKLTKLTELDLTPEKCTQEDPMTLGLSIRDAEGRWEKLEIIPWSESVPIPEKIILDRFQEEHKQILEKPVEIQPFLYAPLPPSMLKPKKSKDSKRRLKLNPK